MLALRLLTFAALLFGAGAAVGGALATTIGPDGASGPAGTDEILPAASLPARWPAGRSPLATVPPSGSTEPIPPRRPPGPLITSGPGSFRLAVTEGPVRGTGGRLHRYQVGVEDGLDEDPDAFADAVDAVLGDPRGWTASGNLRMQRVVPGGPSDFVVLLATPTTSQAICATGGLKTQGFTSCRLPGRVVLNLDRWLTGVEAYGAPLGEYRQYLVNHEVGHQLGHGHEACPGAGRPAPVMQQQTYGLQGCVAYGWPYLDGRRYRGPSVP
jgi:hypothetical protein